LVRVLVIIKKTTSARGLFGGTSAVGRSKVDKEITARNNNDVWLVLIHLEQSIMLKEEHVMKFAPIEMEKDMDYNTDKGVSGWSKDLDKQIMVKTRLESDMVLTFILSY
jgi:hypothetical protein